LQKVLSETAGTSQTSAGCRKLFSFVAAGKDEKGWSVFHWQFLSG